MAAGHGAKPKQEQAIAALLASPSIPAAAKQIGVDESTLDNWLKEPAFNAAYRTARRQVVEQAIAVLQRASVAAVGALVGLLKSEDEGVKLRAAVRILDRAVSGMETLDFESRLAALEARLPERDSA